MQNSTELISVYGRLRQANILNLGKEKSTKNQPL
nr:MAG TPA: hypothetical protein [Caudoviricetes sp.]